MEVRPRKLVEYVKEDGRAPFAEWLAGLRDKQGRALIRKRLDRLQLGNLGDCKPVGDGVKELRVAFGPGYRVYFAEDGETIVLLLCGGDKGSQDADIERAKSYWTDYRR